MKWLLHLFIFILLTASAGEVRSQFWKKKHHHTKATSGKVTKPNGSKYRDPFAKKSRKGPNVKTKRKPFIKSRKKMYKHSTSRKTKKPGNKNFFKPKYAKATSRKKSKDSFSRNANRTKRKSQKGGGSSNGVFKGRKK